MLCISLCDYVLRRQTLHPAAIWVMGTSSLCLLIASSRVVLVAHCCSMLLLGHCYAVLLLLGCSHCVMLLLSCHSCLVCQQGGLGMGECTYCGASAERREGREKG